jgi:cell division protein FtsX
MDFSNHYKTIDKIIDWLGMYGAILSVLIIGMLFGAFLTFTCIAGVFYGAEYTSVYHGVMELKIPIVMQNLPSVDTIFLFLHAGEFLIYFMAVCTVIAVVSLILYIAKFLWNHKKIQGMITKQKN